MSKMKFITNACARSVQMWLCLAVYIWALEFLADIGLDQEPLLDSVTDCAAGLLTMSFWAVVSGLLFVVLALLLRISKPVFLSKLFCQGVAVVATSFYFVRWLDNWSLTAWNTDIFPPIFFASCLTLTAALLLHGRGQLRLPKSLKPPALNDVFGFAAIPVLACAGILVGTQILRFELARSSPKSTTVLPSAEARHTGAKPNVILIVLDALRAQSMSLYGYTRKTTPFLEEFGDHSTLFMRAHSNSTTTDVGMTTLLTGKNPLTHGRTTRYQPRYTSKENLLALLKKNGYTTSAIVSNSYASLASLGFSVSFSRPEILNFKPESLHNLNSVGVRNTFTGVRMYNGLAIIRSLLGLPKRGYGKAGAGLRLARALVSSISPPFFLFLHLHEPHEPYSAPVPFRGRYFTKKDLLMQERTPRLAIYAPYDPNDQPAVDAFRDEYDESISYVDFELGQFLKFLADNKSIDDTLIIVTADHGESFERGYFGHGRALYESSTHIPLIIKWPGQKEGARTTGLVQTIDIAPTILEALKIPIPSWMHGQSLGPGRKPKPSYGAAVNFKQPIGKKVFTSPTKLAIWHERNKAIFNCDSKQAELYDLSADPNERTNLAAERPAVVRDLENALQNFVLNGPAKNLLPCVTPNRSENAQR